MSNIWRQWEKLPDQRVAEQGCSLAVDTSSHNKVTATIGAAADTGDTAACRITTAAYLPNSTTGYVRLHFTTPASFSLANNSTILTVLQSVGVTIIDLYINSSLVLHVFSAADTINHTSLNQSTSLTLSSSTTYTIELWCEERPPQGERGRRQQDQRHDARELDRDVSRLGDPVRDRPLRRHRNVGVDGRHRPDAGRDELERLVRGPGRARLHRRPGLTGTAQEGDTITCDGGTVTSDPSLQYTQYDWKRDGVSIAAGDTFTRVLTSADVGHAITCAVTAVNSWGATTATSAATATVTVGPPTNTTTPSISGNPVVGNTITCSSDDAAD